MSLTDRTHILAQNALDVISWEKIPMYPTQRDATQLDENWHLVVVGSLYRANKILRSVTALLNPALEDSVSATILNRNLFECAANLVYLNQDYTAKLPEFLKKGKFPGHTDETESTDATWIDRLFAGVPKWRWKPLKGMCEELGWADEFKSIYRSTSDASHAGASALVAEYLELHGSIGTDANKVRIVSTTLMYHLRIGEVAAKLFPEAISLNSIRSLQQENEELGWQLIDLPMVSWPSPPE